MIDKLLARRGYTKTEENQYGAAYERQEPQNYTHAITIDHKMSGHHLIHSYDKSVVKSGDVYFTQSCGMEIPVCFLIWLKSVCLSIRYGW